MARRRSRGQDARLLVVTLGFLFAWGGLGLRLFEVQVVRADEFASRGLEQRLRQVTVAADRGTIFDREGAELAVSVEAVTVYANPQEMDDPETAARLVAPLAGADPERLAERLSEGRRNGSSFVYVARKLERGQAERVMEARVPGIHTLEEPKRVYPAGGLAAQVVGVVGIGNEGLEGLELGYDEVLSGAPGHLQVELDPAGRIIPQGRYLVAPAEPGGDLVLTVDREVQLAAERALASTVERTGAAGGGIVVLEPATGAVLAMANWPGFDPNDLAGASRGALRNRAVIDLYEPGSTEKVVTLAAALEEGVVTPGTVFEVPDEIEVWDKTYHDVVPHPTEPMAVSEIVARSSNVGTILIQDALGDRAFHSYLEAFGIGKSTGIDFPGEAAGVLPPVEGWCGPCGASISIGYGISVTALHMAAVFATLANDGVWMQPHLVDEIVDGEGATRPLDPVSRPVVSSETAATVRLLLEGVVRDGTGKLAAVDGYRVGGKTGTTVKYLAQEGRYGDDVVASFIGMAPVEEPQVVVAVVIDTPTRDATGGEAAAPAFSEVMLFALHQMGVPPDAP